MKRFLSIIIIAVLLLTALPATAVGFSTNLTNLRGISGSWVYSGDGFTGYNNGGDIFAMSDTIVTDFTYEADVHRENGVAFSLVFRSSATGSNAYIANIDFSRGTARVFFFGSGSRDLGSQYTLPNPSKSDYHLRLEVIGDSIRYFVDGILAVSVRDTTYKNGYLGLLNYSGTGTYRNVLYEDIRSDMPKIESVSFGGETLNLNGGFDYFLGTKEREIEISPLYNEGNLTISANGFFTDTPVASGAKSPKIVLGSTAVTVTLKITKGDLTLTTIIKIAKREGGGEMADITTLDMIERMDDLKGLAVAAEGETCCESSAYNKLSKYNIVTGKYENWDANDDMGLDAPRSPDGGYIIADLEGAGSVVRIWSADPRQGHVKIFIDGSTTPALDVPFISLFGSGEFPFNRSALCYDAARGKNCYVPINYNNGCKIILYDDWGMYYQVNYISFDEGTQVEPFEIPFTMAQTDALAKMNTKLSGDFVPKGGETKTIKVPAHSSADILNDSGAGAVTGVKIKIADTLKEGEDWDALSEMTFSAYWDGEPTPAVWSTLGGFFASTTGLHEYSSLPLGVTADGTLYSNWYMPYESAKITIGNDGDRDYTIEYTVETEEANAENLLRFHAKWHRLTDPEKGERWPDAQFLYTEGVGRYVGTSLHIYKELGVGDPAYHPDWWWGEGDEKFFVDGEKFPSWFGTGVEDYFGYAWGTWHPFSNAYHAQPFTNGGMFGIGSRLNNRFHIIDSVPFTKSFDANIEKYHRDRYSNMVFTSYWYLESGGKDDYAPVSLAERTAYFAKPYSAPQEFYEGEAIPIIDVTDSMKAETQDMSYYGNGWSGDAQLIFKAERQGSKLNLRVNIPADGMYNIFAAFTKAPDFGIAQHYLDGISFGKRINLFDKSVSVTPKTGLVTLTLKAGYHVVTVDITNKDAASTGYFYGLDYLQFEKISEYGDVNEDGKSNLSDIMRMRTHILKMAPLFGYQLTAGDLNRDNKCDVFDVMLLRSSLLGIS